MENILGLYDHNKISYQKINKGLETSNIVSIVHATGTGKSYNALQLALDNKDKKFVFIVPYKEIISHLKESVNAIPGLDFDKDFGHVDFRTYQSLTTMSDEEIASFDVDYIVLDEFHHIGAPVWGSKVNKLIETHPNAKVLGMTAYTVRDRGTIYERDMAEPNGEELFSNTIVSTYDLCDAILDGVLPKPIYKTAYVNLGETAEKLEEALNKLNKNSKKYQDCKKVLTSIKKQIHMAPGISEVIKRNIKPDGKYIYFCPPGAVENVNDIDAIMAEAKKWFLEMGISEEDIIFYKTTSEMKSDGKKNRNAFYNDRDITGNNVSGKLRVMFAVNQYNEGTHVPNIDGVIMGRNTFSDIVFFEQLGRALSVNGNSKEQYKKLSNLSMEEIKKLIKERNLDINDGVTKEEMIMKLLAPIVIDLTNNYEFISMLETNLTGRVRERREALNEKDRSSKIFDTSFDVELINKELYEMLKYVMDRLHMTWEDKYELAKKYYEHNGNLLVPSKFRTTNGYDFDENGIHLGVWIEVQRHAFNTMSSDRKNKLMKIDFVPSVLEYQWQKNYELAKKYYEHYGDLKIPYRFRTTNGYEYDENGVSLRTWIDTQRSNYNKMSEERKQLLALIEFIPNTLELEWDKKYALAEEYYKHHGNLLVPATFKTTNGYEYDDDGVAIGIWICTQRKQYHEMSEERRKRLDSIGFVLDGVKARHDAAWETNYELAKKYFEYHGNLLIPNNFKTINGYEYDDNGITLGTWISTHRSRFDSIPLERKEKLTKIGFVKNKYEAEWQQKYKLAKKYYEHHGNLLITESYKTINGYDFDENGITLGNWVSQQRQNLNKLPQVKKEMLMNIGLITDVLETEWLKKYELAKKYYEHYGNLSIVSKYKTINGYEYDENGIDIGSWLIKQRTRYDRMSEERKTKLLSIGFVPNLLEHQWQSNYELAKVYYSHNGTLAMPYNFKTTNGYEYDEQGIEIARWLGKQRIRYAGLSEERKMKLMLIGFVLDIKINTQDIIEICNKNNIDYDKNKLILSKISLQEFIAKINFLKSKEISLVDNDLLHEIFSMSSPMMSDKYGFSLEQLITDYYLKSIKAKENN